MNSARKLAPLSSPRRNLRIVARCSEPLAPADLTSIALQAQPFGGLHLVQSGKVERASHYQADTLEQARRIVSQVEREIVSRAARDRSVRLRLCTPLAATPAAPKERRFFSRFRAFASSLQTLFASR